MEHLLLVIRSYYRKSRFQVTVIAIMLLQASIILGIASVLMIDYKDNFFRMHDELHAEHVVMDYASLTDGTDEFIEKTLKSDSAVSEFELTEASFAKGTCPYGEDGILSSVFSLIRITDAKSKSIGQFEIIDEIETGDGYIPYIFKSNGFYQSGDTFTQTINGQEQSFVIKGFYSNMTTGTVNCRDVVILLTDEKYEELASNGFASGYRISVRLNQPSDAETMESELINELSTSESGLTLIDATNYIKLSKIRYMSTTIFSGILCAASVVIIVVLLAVVAVSLSNYIKENMKNLGIMKAVGYESRYLSGPVILSLSLLTLVCTSVGYGLSYLLLPITNSILEKQSGIPYEIRFLSVPGLITVGIILLSVLLTTVLSVSKIRTILPITAIRPSQGQGKTINVFPLKNGTSNLNLKLGMKTIFSDVKKYIVFLISSCLITMMLCMAAYCIESIVNHPENIIRMVIGNTEDVSVSVSTLEEQQFTSWLDTQNEVENAYVYTHSSACHDGGKRIDVIIRDAECNRQSEYLLTEGSLPQNENEIAVNFAYADDYNLKIGDEMTLTKDGVNRTYTISGLFQNASSSGKDVTLLREGYERLAPLTTISYLIDLSDGTDIDDFITKFDIFSTVSAINYRDFISGMSATYISMLDALVMIIAVISLFIAVMVLAIIVNMILFKKRREHGILKSLGFITPQIVFQTAVSFVPVAVTGSLIGLIISRRGISMLFSSFVNNIGIASFGDSISLTYLIHCGALFTVFTFAVTCLLSVKIRKILPHDLFNNE